MFVRRWVGAAAMRGRVVVVVAAAAAAAATVSNVT
jgi:hypothetical protein